MTGIEFRTQREAMDLTQAQLSKLLDVTETTLYRWENDIVQIPRTVELALKQIAAERSDAE